MPDLQTLLTNLPNDPGVYRMLDEHQHVLYVGKASNLKKRVSSYFNKHDLSPKTRSLVSQIVNVEISITRSETEALLLESNLIKSLRPKYNVLMRDDKSYPFIHIASEHDFPRIEVMRCKKKPENGDFFGPYPSVTAVRETMGIIQKVFKIRNCSDTYFSARTRPCLQYQIKRCTAPCTAYITQADYKQSLMDAKRFLQGKSQQILEELAARMQEAVDRLAFEEAVVIRDQIKNLRLVQEQQGVVQSSGDADVIVIEARPGFACVQCVRVRLGEVLASDSFFPKVPQLSLDDDDNSIWQHVFDAFIAYYYLDTPERIPSMILTNHPVDNVVSLQNTLSALRSKVCEIKTNPRGSKARWLDFALNNLRLSISKHNTSSNIMQQRLASLGDFIAGEKPILRMECFDISHTQGDATVASCVVFDEQGPCKRDYRRFNINDITPGDDYAAMEQALTRRYKRLAHDGQLPDLLIIDGGKGQVAVAKKVLTLLGIDNLMLLGIAKGPTRKAGWERLILSTESQEKILPSDSPALHLLQHIRDEAHRFAITAHRKKRQKSSFSSSLETLTGIGPKRRQALLQRFGGIRELSKASIDELTKVRGISQELAMKIYQHFH